jgi:hypothetical protein
MKSIVNISIREYNTRMEAENMRTVKTTLPLTEEQKTFVPGTMNHAAQVCALSVQLIHEQLATSYKCLNKFSCASAKAFSPVLAALVQSPAQQALAWVKSWNLNHTTPQWQYRKKAQQLSLNKLCLSRRGNLKTFYCKKDCNIYI